MRRKLFAFSIAALTFVSLSFGLGPGGVSARDDRAKVKGEHVSGEVIVKFKAGVGRIQSDRVLSSESMSVKSESRQLGFKVVKLPGGTSVAEAVEELSSDPRVEYAEPNYIDQITWTPDDPEFGNQWHMQGFASGGMDAQTAWDTERGDSSVIIAVVDTGVAYENYNTYTQAPDLTGTTFVSPYDAVDYDGHPNDTNGHGTHVTGTIAQTTNNSLGCAGVAHGCTIMPVRSLGTGGGSHAQMADAFAWAADHGADIINYSAGGSDSTTKRNGCLYAHNLGVTICASAGNNSTYNDTLGYPANYDDLCVCVGGTDRTKALAWYSNYGTHQDIVGPGGDTTADSANGVKQQTYVTPNDPASGFSYQGWQGTSMACPHVSATAALYISKTGVTDPHMVQEALQSTAHDLGTGGRDDYFGYGLIDAGQALAITAPHIDQLDPAEGLIGSSIAVQGSGFGSSQGYSTVSFNGTPVTSYGTWSDTEVAVQVPAGAATGPVTVTTIGGTSNSATFTVNNPVPSITSLDPDHVTAGDAGFTMTVNGTGFVDGASVVRWNGSALATTFVAGNQLSAQVPAANVAAAGTASITVFNPTPGGGTSNSATFTVNNPVPSITSLDPDHVTAGDAGFTMTVNGTGFVDGASVVRWNGSALATTFVAGNQLSAQVPAANVAAAGTASITVFNPTPGGGTSNSATFTVTQLSPSSTWYLAEGTCAWGFDTYISIMNPNPSALTANITYMLKGGATETLDVPLPANSQTTVNPRDTVGDADFSTRVVSSDPTRAIAVDRTMSWTGGAGAGPGAGSGAEAHSSVGVNSASQYWYMPEGSTKWGFETWLCIQNPNAGKATCQVTYMIEGSDPITKTKEVAGNSRETYNMREDIGERDASIKVHSDVPVIPERSMYRNSRREGHESIGASGASQEFYLAEGTTAYGFTSYVCVQNPNSTAVEVNLIYMTPTGPVPHPGNPIPIPANSRKTIRVNDVLPDSDFSTKVSCPTPIVAERAMYWDSGTGEAAHDSIGMSVPHRTFYLPDGQSSEGRETYVCVQNPNGSAVSVTLTYLKAGGGSPVVKTESIGANSRRTFSMLSHSGISGRASVMVTSNTAGKKIMVERAMYWNSRGAGTDTIGGCE